MKMFFAFFLFHICLKTHDMIMFPRPWGPNLMPLDGRARFLTGELKYQSCIHKCCMCIIVACCFLYLLESVFKYLTACQTRKAILIYFI